MSIPPLVVRAHPPNVVSAYTLAADASTTVFEGEMVVVLRAKHFKLGMGIGGIAAAGILTTMSGVTRVAQVSSASSNSQLPDHQWEQFANAISNDKAQPRSVIEYIDGLPVTQRTVSEYQDVIDFGDTLSHTPLPTAQQIMQAITRQYVWRAAAQKAGYTATKAQAVAQIRLEHQYFIKHENAPMGVGSYTVKQFMDLTERVLGITDSQYWGSFQIKAEEDLISRMNYRTNWVSSYEESNPKASPLEVGQAWNNYLDSLVSEAQLTH